MVAREGFGTTDARDASLADFSHALGHDCAHCRAIRSLGPAGFTSVIGKLMASAQGTVVDEEDAIQRLPKKQRRKAARLAHKRGYSGLLAAIRAA